MEQKTLSQRLAISDDDVVILDNIVSLVNQHGKEAKVIDLALLHKFDKPSDEYASKNAHVYVKANMNPKQHYEIIMRGQRHIYMLNYVGALIYIKKHGRHSLYLSHYLTDEEQETQEVNNDSYNEAVRTASRLFCDGMTSIGDFCFSLNKTYSLLGYKNMFNTLRAFNKNKIFEPDIDYITCVDKNLNETNKVPTKPPKGGSVGSKKNIDDVVSQVSTDTQLGVSAGSKENSDRIREGTEYMLTRDAFRAFIFNSGTEECKMMRRYFSKILTRFETGDLTLIPEIIKNSGLDNFNTTFLQANIEDNKASVTAVTVSTKTVSMDDYNKLRDEFETLKSMVNTNVEKLEPMINDTMVDFTQNLNELVTNLTTELADHPPNKIPHSIFAYIRDGDNSETKYCTFGYVSTNDLPHYSRRLTKLHGSGLFISKPICFPIGKHIKQLIRQICHEENIARVMLQGKDKKIRQYFEMMENDARRIINSIVSPQEDRHNTDTKNMITQSVQPLDGVVTKRTQEIGHCVSKIMVE